MKVNRRYLVSCVVAAWIVLYFLSAGDEPLVIEIEPLQPPPPPPPRYVPQLATKKHLLIVGAAGYVGSGVASILAHRNVLISGFDRNPRAKLPAFQNVTYAHGRDVPDRVLRSVDAVLYLGGFTGRVVCEKNTWERVMQENVHDVVDFAKRMGAEQIMMFASTSAIGEGSGSRAAPFKEDDQPQTELFDAYTRSMYEREKAMRTLIDTAEGLPRLVGLRFGTILGVSPSQRIEFVHVAMVRNALLNGRITVRHPETWRSFLAVEDLADAVLTLMASSTELQRKSLNLYHLVSFSSTVEQAANEVASVIGVPVSFEDHVTSDIVGFRLSAEKFSRQFNFLFGMTARSVVERLIEASDHVKVSREITDHKPLKEGSKCVVCGSSDVVVALDLGDQPLANDFRSTPESAESCEKHPLRLHRCRRCYHAQLSKFVSRKSLFSNYSYRSGTSTSLNDYFSWLATRVTKETDDQRTAVAPPNVEQKKILEIACNDGTQLTHFKKLGWKTFGVDPAANLVKYARSLGHTVAVGLWGAGPNEEFSVLPEKVDAIVAQNVLAHVPDPNSFVQACVERMHDTTLLYLQTSQCEMFANGQFDTIYHEHISFFSPSSFLALADRQGLQILKYEITPIHGGSCFATMMKKSSKRAPAVAGSTLTDAIALDGQRRAMTDAYYVEYRQRVMSTRDWIAKVLESAHARGIQIAGYGAAAKGIVLLNYVLEKRPKFDFSFVVDDAPLKQNTFCPGTRIPVKPTAELANVECDKDLLLVVFSWNFWDEIRSRIVRAMVSQHKRCHREFVWVLLPFPEQRLLSLSLSGSVDSNGVTPSSAERRVAKNPFSPPDLPLATLSPSRRKILMVTHFFNEELLLPYFIRHHAPMFDRVILIDSNSTDRSVELIKKLAPSTWTVVQSVNPNSFHYKITDLEVAKWEAQFPGWWKIALTTTEFLVHPNLRAFAEGLDSVGGPVASHHFFRFRSVYVVGSDEKKLGRFAQLGQQRFEYRAHVNNHVDFIDYWTHYSRFMHHNEDRSAYSYTDGRHEIKGLKFFKIPMVPEGFIMKFAFSPWPELKERKLQVGSRIPPEHVKKGFGAHHTATSEALDEKRSALRNSTLLSLDAAFAACRNVALDQVHSDWQRTFEAPVDLKHECGFPEARTVLYPDPKVHW